MRRVRFLALLAVAGLGFTGGAKAGVPPISCTSLASGSEGFVRVEGETEQLPDITISGCTGTAPGTSVSLTLTLNAPIANLALQGGVSGSVDAVGILTPVSGSSVSVAGIVSPSSSTAVNFTFPVVQGASVTSIVLKNLRVNASNLLGGATLTVTGTGVNGIILTAPPANAAFVTGSLASPTVFLGLTSVALCSTAASDVNSVGTVTISENFASAFTSDTDEYGREPAAALALSGNPVTSSNTVGTRLAVTFANLINGATYYLPTTLTSTNDGQTLTLVLVPSATSTEANALTGTTIGGSISGVYGFPVSSGGTFTAYYAVNADSQTAVESVTAALYEVLPNHTLTVPGTAPSVSVSVAGRSTANTYAQFAVSSVTPVSAPTGGIVTACPAPDLTITSSHTDGFTQDQSGAIYTLSVLNRGSAATSGTVTVTDTLPAGMTATAISGSGWSCTLATLTCTRGDALAASVSWSGNSAITVTVNVGAATGTVSNSATVGGGGETNTSNDSASDSTTIGAATISISGGPPLSGGLFPLGRTAVYPLSGTGGLGPYTLSAVGTLPPGVTLLTGNAQTAQGVNGDTLDIDPSVEGNYSFTIQAADANGLTGTVTYSILVPGFTGPLTSALPNASVGALYSQQLYAFDNDPGVTLSWSATSDLPCGLSISATGMLSGTPSAGGTCSFNLTVTTQGGAPRDRSGRWAEGNIVGSASFPFSFTVSNLAISNPQTLPTAVAGVPYSYQMAATGGTSLTWSATVCPVNVLCSNGLPYGLTISASGLISGTPAYSSATFSPLITVTDGSSPLSLAFTLPVSLANPAPLSFDAAPTLKDAVANQPYEFPLKPSGGVAPYTWSVAESSAIPCNLTLLSGAALPSDQPAGSTVLAGEPSPAGSCPFSLTVADSAGSRITRNFTLNVTPVNLAPGSLRSAVSGVSYSQQLTATGGTVPYTFHVNDSAQAAIFPGLTLANGVISGTPIGTGSVTFPLQITDSSANSITRFLMLNVVSPQGEMITSTNQNVELGAAVNVPLTVTGGTGPFNWTQPSGTMPAGLSITGSAITGSVGTAGTYTFLVEATDTANGDTPTRQFTYTVSPLQLVAPALQRAIPGVLPAATVGTAYSFQLKAANGAASYTFSTQQASALAALGLSVSSAGLISGTPTMSGVFPINIVVTDSATATLITPAIHLTIAPQGAVAPLDTKSQWSLNDASAGSIYAALLDPILAGGTPPYTWSLASGSSLPPGIGLAAGANGVSSALVGSPTTTGTYTFSLHVADAGSETLTVPMSLHVSPLTLSMSVVSGSDDSPVAQSVAPNRGRFQPRLVTPAGTVNTPYSRGISITGGTPPYSTFVPVGDVPGLTFIPDVSGTSGTLSGTPTAAGVFPLRLDIVDANGQTLNVAYEFLVDNTSGEVPTVSLSPEPVTVSYTPGSTAPGPIPVDASLSTGSLPYSAAVEGISFASLTGASGSTPGTMNLNFDVNAEGLATAYGLVAVSAPGAVNQQDLAPVTFTVAAPQAQTITFAPFNPVSIAYGTAAPALSATASSGLQVSYSASPAGVCAVSGSTLTISGAGTCSVTAMQAGSTNFAAATSVTQMLTITPESQTITFGAFTSIAFGGAAPALTATASSGLTVSYSVSPAGVCAVSGSMLTISGVGTCSVTAMQGGSTNFAAATSVTHTLTITQGSQTITFPVLSNVAFGGAAPALSAIASSGLPVSYQAGPPTICTISGSSLTLVGAGLCSVTASQAGTANFAAAASVVQSFSVTPGTQTISFGPIGTVTLGAVPPVLSATASSGLVVSYSAGPPAVCTVAGASLTLVGAGTCSVTASQAGNANYAAATSVTQTFTVAPTLTVTTTSLPAAAQQSAYSQVLAATGGSGGNVWAVASGALPGGLSLGTDGTISGTPTGIGSSSFTARVTDSAGDRASQFLTVLVNPALTITTLVLPDVASGIAYTAQLGALGGSGGYTWSLASGSLPSGISLAGSGAISGTSTATGTATFTITVTDSAGNQATRGLTLKVDTGVSITTTTLSDATQGNPYDASLGATGGNGVYTWTVVSGSLPAGLSLSSNGVLAGTPSAAGGSTFTVKATDQRNASATQALFLKVDAALTVTTSSLPAAVQGSAYSQSVSATGGTGTLTWNILTGSVPNGLSLGSTGSISGTPGSAGSSAFTVRVTDQAGNHALAGLSILVNPQLTIGTTSLKNAVSGAAYNQTLTASGGSGTYTWSISGGSLPTGISLGASGALTGTTNVAGPFSFTAQVADQAGNTKTQGFTLQVNAVLSISSSATLPSGVTGKAYSSSFTAAGGTGGPYTWSVASGTLPPGISLGSAGALTGNPSVAGPFSFTVQVADGTSVPAQLAVSTTVYNVLAITTTFLPNGTAGQSYGPVNLATTGGSGNVTWSVSGLPAGLNGSSAGAISGTTSVTGNVTLGITATDATSAQTVQSSLGLNIVAAAGPLTISPSSLVLGAGVGGNISGGFTTTGGTPPLTWSIAGGSLPAGVSLSASTGSVSGAAGQAGNTTATVSVTDGKTTATAQLVINALGFATTSIPAGAATVAYSAGFSATGGTPPYVFSATGLPPGISMGGGGTVTGTVATPGSYPFSAQVSDSQGLAVSSGLTLTVRNAPVSVKAPSLPNATVGIPYSQVLSATGGNPPYTWSTVSGALPTGLSLAASGTISGNPSVPGPSLFAVQATDSTGGVASAQATILVQPSTLAITTTSLPSGVVGFDYPAQVLGASGGTSPYTFSITGGGLPAGVNLAGGVISGNPTTAGTYPLTLGVTDAGGATASANVTLTVRPSTSDLLLSSGSVSFSLASGTASVPDSQTVSVQSTVAAQPVSYTFAVAPDSPWLNVSTGSQTPNSLSIGLTAEALTFSPGSYSATVTLTCTSTSCKNNTQSVAVELTVSAPPPQLSVLTSLLSFSSNSTPPRPQSQPLEISNTGGGTITVDSVSCEASWCSVSGVPASLTPGASAQVTVTVDPTQIGNGFFRTAVDVTTSAGSVTVPVNFFVTQTVSMTLSPSGSQFQMQQGGAPGNPSGSFLVGVSGGSTNWSATVLPGAPWISLGTASGAATATQPGAVSFSINSAAASLVAQAQYGTIEVTGPGLVNSPQDYQVVLNVQAPTTSVQPDPEPGGLLFLTTVGSGSPAAQVVTVYSSSAMPVSYQASANAAGGDWLAVAPTLGTTSSSAPDTSTVTVNTAGLTTGTYTGGISYASTGAAVRTVNVTLVVAPAGGAAVKASGRQTSMSAISPQGTCSPSSLVAAPTSLVANFSAPTSWPTPLAISLVNDCGQFVTDGQVTATFSNGDPPLALPLVNASTGLYSATWTPRNAASQVTVLTRATSASGLAPAQAQIAGSVVPNAAPVINPQATVHAFNPQVGGPLAPGTIIAVYGANLASQVSQPKSIPLDTTMNGTSVIIGGIPAPLFYVSPGQINVQVPFELDPSKQYQVVVSANGAIATPQTIQMTPAVPGLAAFGDGTLIAQHLDGSLVLASSPAQPGEYIVMYLLGMGLTSNQVSSGNASPGPPGLATPDVTATLTLGGQPVNILFQGMTPGLVGLYQIDIQVPQNTTGGNQLLVVSQNGLASNTTILPVQVQ